MGICSSCESTNVATAKLILQDGRLEEFSYPVKVSYILAKNPTSFICNSDDMDFDNFVSAIDGDEQLQLGELYFALPLGWLNYPIRAEEMASLVAKASKALKMDGGKRCCGCGLRRVDDPLLFRSSRVARSNGIGGCGGGGGGGGGGDGHGGDDSGRFVVKKKRRGSGGGKFIAKMSVILEE